MSYPEFDRLMSVIAKLRHPTQGCPWDLEQTHESLKKYLLEESYELLHAIDSKDSNNIKDELGDVLLQLLLHSKIEEEKTTFSFEDVCKNLADKMIRRHPHVFENDQQKIDSVKVTQNWDKIKQTEKTEESLINKNVLYFPALFSAYKIGKKTNKIGFDWDGPQAVQDKVQEEWGEFCEARQQQDSKKIQEELGDFLFTIAQLARHLNYEPEELLNQANAKFLKRFHLMESLISKDHKNILNMNQEEMELYWKKVKHQEMTKC